MNGYSAESDATAEHVHVWEPRQNVTSKGYALPPYEACACAAARRATSPGSTDGDA